MIPGLPSIGGGEILILLVIILLLFGAKRIPELARSLGRGTREFREGISGIGEDKDAERDHKEKNGEKQSLEGLAPAETPRMKEKAEPARAEQES